MQAIILASRIAGSGKRGQKGVYGFREGLGLLGLYPMAGTGNTYYVYVAEQAVNFKLVGGGYVFAARPFYE